MSAEPLEAPEPATLSYRCPQCRSPAGQQCTSPITSARVQGHIQRRRLAAADAKRLLLGLPLVGDVPGPYDDMSAATKLAARTAFRRAQARRDTIRRIQRRRDSGT